MKKNEMTRSALLCMAAGALITLTLGAACTKVPPPSHLDGLWYWTESGVDEGLGRYKAATTWIISGESYQQYEERTSEQAMHWHYGSRGAITITDKELKLRPREAIFQMTDWEPVEKGDKRIATNYIYVLDGDELSIDDNNGQPVVLRKSPFRYEATMFGAQTLEIRLTIGSIAASGEVSGAYYQYYNSKRRKYGDPIILTGHLEEGTLTLYEPEPKDPAVNRAVMRFPAYTFFIAYSESIDGTWQDLREGKESNTYELSLNLETLD
jgi:hypothetical protein